VTVTPASAPSPTARADAVVVGAGPAGAATARFLADAGRDVVLLEKATFPRDKVCGDALTPRAVRALAGLGLTDEAAGDAPGWHRQRGLRMYGGRTRTDGDGTTRHEIVLDLPWPELPDWPAHSLTATRSLFDETLARHAQKGGVQLWEACEVTGPVWLTTSEERIAGVTYRRARDADVADGSAATGTVRAPVVVACDGNSARLGLSAGLHRDPARPMGVAVRAYYDHARPELDMMEGFLDIESDGRLLPAYGWVFPLDDGTVNVGWGQLDSSSHFRGVSYPKVLDEWTAGFPPEWGVTPDTRHGRPKSAGLPMSHNRRPAVHKGLVLVGDAAGMVNPFNGEGISYASMA
jgi:geranylgeranyl reductase family protein